MGDKQRQVERFTFCTCIIQADSDTTLSKGGSWSDTRMLGEKQKYGRTRICSPRCPAGKRGKLGCPTRVGDADNESHDDDDDDDDNVALMLKEEMLFLWNAK